MSSRLVAASRREQILLIARTIFARVGYEATRTATIAEEAGVSERLLYKHFRSKQEIFLTVVQEVAEGVAALYRTLAEADLSVFDGISQLYAIRFTLPDAPGSRQPLFFGRTYGPFDDPAMDDALGAAYRVMAEGGAAYFESLARRGLLRPVVDPEAAAWMLAGLFREHESLRLAYGPDQVANMDRRILLQFVDAIALPDEHVRQG